MKKASDLRDSGYYLAAHQGSLDLTHPSTRKLLDLSTHATTILDMGCGEGTRLSLLISKKMEPVQAFGVDISQLAIQKARKQYPKIKFVQANLEKLKFRDEMFDLIFSAYVFEHLVNPEKVLLEASRILKPKGILVIIAPNFGSPNRRSPNSTESKIQKLVKGFVKDISNINQDKINKLNWTKVEPQTSIYKVDSDATIEPYLHSLILYTKGQYKISYYSSFWDQDKFSLFQLIFRVLGLLNIYPFKFWGPHLMVVLEKKNE